MVLSILVICALIGFSAAGTPFNSSTPSFVNGSVPPTWQPPQNFTGGFFNFSTQGWQNFTNYPQNASTPSWTWNPSNSSTSWPIYNASTPSANWTYPPWNFTTGWPIYNASTPSANWTYPPWNFTTGGPIYNGSTIGGTNWTNPWTWLTTPTPGNNSCPQGWIASNSSYRTCYYNSFSAPVDYLAATQFCSVLVPGAYVIAIGNAFENSEARELGSTGSFWLGLDRFHGSWQWANGDNSTYRHWAPNEPAGDANCASANRQNGLWYGTDCKNTLPVVCELHI